VRKNGNSRIESRVGDCLNKEANTITPANVGVWLQILLAVVGGLYQI
jgi:hypothetical protein